MDELEQIIRQTVEKIAGGKQIKQVLLGTATDITDTDCTVLRDDAPKLFNVRLNAVDDDLQSRVTVYPAEGSNVLVAIIENQVTEAVVLKCSEVDKVVVRMGGTALIINDKGYTVSRAGENLQKILLDLIAEIAKIVVVIGTSPNVPELTAIGERIKKLLQ